MSQPPDPAVELRPSTYAFVGAYGAAKRRWQNWRASVAGRSIGSAVEPRSMHRRISTLSLNSKIGKPVRSTSEYEDER